MSTLERAIAIAATAHTGQQDKAGQPYICHPLRVMLALTTLNERIVGVLHDVIEDTNISPEILRAEGFSDVILTALESVTKREGEDYTDFIRRAAADPIGRRVKLADLLDNSDLSRIARPTPHDHARGAKYRTAIELLQTLSRQYPSGQTE